MSTPLTVVMEACGFRSKAFSMALSRPLWRRADSAFRFMGCARFGAFPEGFVGRSHLPGHVACHLSWQPEPLAQILVHQSLQFHVLRYLPAPKATVDA